MPAILSGSSRHFHLPSIVANTPRGVAIIANGLDTVRRWDGLTTALEVAGIPQAGSGMVAADGGGGAIPDGTYYYAVRYIDDEGQPGDLQATLTSVTLSGGGSDVDLSSIPTGDSRTVAREIFRSTLGQSTVFYKITTLNDNSTTTYTDNATDAAIQALTVLPLLFPDGSVQARRFGVPPSYCRVAVQHDEFMIYGVPAFYSYGHAEMTNGSATVTIVGGLPTTAMIGRKFAIKGHATEYTISNVSGQTVTLSSNYTGTTDVFGSYSIYPDKATWRRLYPSYLGEPESVYDGDAWDVMSDPSAEGALTGIYSFNSFVYVTTPSHTFRWSFRVNPNKDGAMFPAFDRGMLNPRCCCRADNILGVLDRSGIYLSTGGSVNPISEPIQDFFRNKIVWERKDWFFAVAYAEEETMRFFVCLDGSRYPKHALCLNYTTSEWWVEEYPWMISSACVVPMQGRKRLLLGAEHERISVYGEGVTDGLPAGKAAPGRYTVSSATPMSTTVASAGWDLNSDINGLSLHVISGRGRGQVRRIVQATKSSGRLDIDHNWTIQPDATSIVVIGGIRYVWQSDVLDMAAHYQKCKDIKVTIDPTDEDSNVVMSLYRNKRSTKVTAKTAGTNAAGGVINKDEDGWLFNVKRNQGTLEDREHDGAIWVGIDDGFHPRNPAENRFVAVEVSGCTEQDPIVMQNLDVMGAG